MDGGAIGPSTGGIERVDALGRLREFTRCVGEVTTLADLRALVGEVVASFEVEYFLMTHHVDFGRPAPGSVQMSNYPAEFVALQRQNGGWRDDPVMLACERTVVGFFWSDVGSLVPLTEHHLRRFEGGRRFGLGDGFVVPHHLPGEYSGSVHFTVRRNKEFPRHLASAFQSLAAYSFEAARRLARTDAGPLPRASLTSRQIDCLLLSARGKSDSDIGDLLGIKPCTVNEHIEGAKRRYCVATRQQAIVLALFNSEITYAEILQQR